MGSTYRDWANNVDQLLKDLAEQINEYRHWGYKIIGYGAAAKGMTLLNASGLYLDAVVDDNPLKQGTWCPGVDIPVVGIEYVANLEPEDKVIFVPLAWNFFKEIVQRIRAVRVGEHDMFVRYFPELKTEFYDQDIS
jgi:hypothetical protein